MDLERLPAELRCCDGPRLETADVLDDRARVLIPVDGRIVARERTGIRRLAVILRRARRGARGDIAQRAHEQIRSHDGKAVEELSRRLEFTDRRLSGIDHVAGIHFAVEVHGRNAGHGIAVEHRPLDRRSAAVLRQQRAVDVHRPVGRDREQVIRQNAAIGHNNENVRPQALEISQRRAVAHLCRLEHRQPRRERDLLDRARLELHAAVFRLVRLREYADHVKPLVEQALQGHGRKIRRAHKHDAHAPHPFACCSSSSGESIRIALSMNRTPSRWSISWQKARAVRPRPSTSNHSPWRSCARTFT